MLRKLVVVGCSITIVSACFMSCIRSKKGGGGGGSFLSAEIDGVDEEDKKSLENPKFELLCNENSPGAYTLEGKSADSTWSKINFPSEKITSGHLCSLNISSTTRQRAGRDLVWLATKQAKPVEGLFYASSTGAIEEIPGANGQPSSRGLALKLYKVYRVSYSDGFEAMVKFKVMRKPTIDPEFNPSTLVATMTCDNDVKESSKTLTTTNISADEYSAVFSLSSQKMKNLSCFRLDFLRENKLAYSADLSGVKFGEPKPQDTFAKEPSLSFQSQVVYDSARFQFATRCAAKNVTSLCITAEIGDLAGVVLAYGKYSDQLETAPETEFVLSNIEKAPTLSSKPKVDLVKALLSFNNVKSMPFSWINKPAADIFRQASEFNQAAVAAVTQPTAQITAQQRDSAKGIVYDSFERFGFGPVELNALNQVSNPIWFVHVRAKSGTKIREFLVSRSEKYFRGPRSTPETPWYKSEDARTFAGGSTGGTIDSYAFYAIKSEHPSAQNFEDCNMSLRDLMLEIGASRDEQFVGTPPAIPSLDACKLGVSETSGLSSTDVVWDETVYVRGWFDGVY